MIKLFLRRFVKNYENVQDKNVRASYGILAGIVGIICNLFLFAVKLTAGTLMNSISIISDSINNLSDMGSSLVTVIGSKISNRNPDKEHPFGHGRVEYISSLIVSFIILLVGFELLKTSFGKIFEPQKVEFNLILFIILCLSLLVKVWMFSYNRYLGGKINSSVLRAAASDSINDVMATSVVLISTLVGRFIDFPLDGIMGVLVSGLVMYTGFGIAKDTVGVLLGNPPSPETVSEITSVVLSGEGIIGLHDLIVHDYGPGRVMASVHAEVPDDIDIVKIHEVIDATEQRILNELGIHIVIHMDPLSIHCERTSQLRDMVQTAVNEVNPQFSIHDFRLTDGENRINLIFDMAVPCTMKEEEREDALQQIQIKIQQQDTRYNTVITVDNSF